MTPLDRLLQRWRISKARPYIRPGARVLDIGCADAALFRRYGDRIREGVGIDPELAEADLAPRWQLIHGQFPDDLSAGGPFDVITMLAVLEHIPPGQQARVAEHCARLLRPGGHLVITVPSPAVDPILWVLTRLRLLEGIALEQHYGFDAAKTPSLFAGPGLLPVVSKKFQLGLNNLYVFRKERSSGAGQSA